MEDVFCSPILDSGTLSEINVVQTGSHRCPPGHAFGPAVRDYYIIHHIISGKGYFEQDGKVYSLKSGDCFFIGPHYVTKYYADENDPWYYVWISFTGSAVSSLLEKTFVSRQSPVFNISDIKSVKSQFLKIEQYAGLPHAGTLSLIGCLCGILDGLANPEKNISSGPEEYVNNAISYINANIHLPISVEAIASLSGINRKYFCRIFKKYTGLTPMQYILQAKLEKAKLLLRTTSASVGDIARSVGYDDIFSFSRMFSSQVGIAPSQYRKK